MKIVAGDILRRTLKMKMIKFEDQWYDVNDIKRIELCDSGTKFRVFMTDGTIKRLGKPQGWDGKEIFITR